MPGDDVALDFNIDDYINHIIPSSRLYILHPYISWFFGYRQRPRPRIGALVVWFWAFVGAFCGIVIIEGVFSTPYFKSNGTPLVIGSFGAAAILEYNTIDSPLSQPRNAVLGQVFASIIGVSITKLFQLSPNFQQLRWAAGALAVGVTSAVMGLTNTIHPPAGATALLAATSDEITGMGWYLMPVVLLGSLLMIATACVVNNIQRTFPIYWWTPLDLDPIKKGRVNSKAFDSTNGNEVSRTQCEKEEEVISIGKHQITVPQWIQLEYEERAVLEVLRSRLHDGLQNCTVESDRTRVHHSSDGINEV